MKNKTYDPEPLSLAEGYYADQYYDSYEMLAQSTQNWKQLCPYQLQAGGISGRQQVLHLHSMQIVFAERKGGTMHNAGSAKKSLSISVVESCADKACFGRIKIQTGDILFFDDTHPHNFITNGTVKFAVITIKKSHLGSRLPELTKAIDHCIKDTDTRFSTILYKTLERFTELKNMQDYQEAENEILTVITELLSQQIPFIPKLTAGERIVLDIRNQIFEHMDGRFSIASLAEQHQISEQTLQNSFKSLFGFTPKRFLRLLKLNLVHNELMESNPNESSVSKVALKWGFSHMGRFSSYYTELFGENPSQTLKKTSFFRQKSVIEACVVRQEEID